MRLCSVWEGDVPRGHLALRRHLPFAYFKHHFRDFVQVAFLDAQDAENDFALPFDTLKHRFIDFTKVVF
jgi:hypothetical protein